MMRQLEGAGAWKVLSARGKCSLHITVKVDIRLGERRFKAYDERFLMYGCRRRESFGVKRVNGEKLRGDGVGPRRKASAGAAACTYVGSRKEKGSRFYVCIKGGRLSRQLTGESKDTKVWW